MKPKKELVRVVRTPNENIEVDPTGKKLGRGAYVCPQADCLRRAVREKRLEKALQRPVSKELYDILAQGLNADGG